MNIIPDSSIQSHRTGTLNNIMRSKIIEILGFEPNIEDDPYKVENSWGFTVDGEPCAIWDYRGSHHSNSWSTFGPSDVFVKLFGKCYS